MRVVITKVLKTYVLQISKDALFLKKIEIVRNILDSTRA